MARLITVLTIVAILVWTLLSLGAWAVVGVSGDLLRSLAGWSSVDVSAVEWLVRLLQGVGFGVVIAAWALGTAMLGVIGYIARRFARSVELGAAQRWQASRWPDIHEPDPRAMKDVTPRDSRERPALPPR